MNEYVIAKYIRLSIDDGITESLSIPSQRKLIDSHIDELGIPNATVLEFIDNGHTGTVMERPAVIKMLDLVMSGGINCIIIKDFSRFSRNVTESSYLIDQVFPLYRIRFISVGDRFDSGDYKGNTGGINVACKYIVNEYYSIDLSKKVKSAKRSKMARGEHIVKNAIYGYRKNESGKWEPDTEAAKVVRQIFEMALEGLATSQIRDKLRAAMYPTPMEYIEIKRGKDIVPEYMWTARMVLHTLTNEQYTGSYVSGKQVSKAVGSHSKIHTDKSEWIIIPDSHPPIVSKEDFVKVQELLTHRKGSTTNKPLKSDMSSSKRARMMKGASIAGTPIYGYLKADGGKWEIDEPAAAVVREIYEFALQGLLCSEISIKLFGAEYPTPSEYIKRYKGNDIIPTNRWTEKCVRSILKNIQYTGAYVSGKILTDYESGKKYHTPKNEWIIIPDKHPAIISKETFEKVQELNSNRRTKRKNMRPRDYLLHGKIACGNCGYAMMYDDSTSIKVYRCLHTLANPSSLCHKTKVNATELDEAVLAMIKKQTEFVLNDEGIKRAVNVDEIKKASSDYDLQIRQTEERRKNCYEQYIRGDIEREQYLFLKNECTTKIKDLKNRLVVLGKAERDKQTSRNTMETAKSALGDSARPQDIVNALVEKVYVFPDFRIEIDWKFADFTIIG